MNQLRFIIYMICVMILVLSFIVLTTEQPKSESTEFNFTPKKDCFRGPPEIHINFYCRDNFMSIEDDEISYKVRWNQDDTITIIYKGGNKTFSPNFCYGHFTVDIALDYHFRDAYTCYNEECDYYVPITIWAPCNETIREVKI